jgi:hypothetical protein
VLIEVVVGRRDVLAFNAVYDVLNGSAGILKGPPVRAPWISPFPACGESFGREVTPRISVASSVVGQFAFQVLEIISARFPNRTTTCSTGYLTKLLFWSWIVSLTYR